MSALRPLARVALLVIAVALVACRREGEDATATAPSGPAAATSATAAPAAISDQDISDAYIYLLSRALVARQQRLDFAEGMQWNQLSHRRPGAVEWPNPNLDVAYSEAWVAVDEHSCTLIEVPRIEGRYYTVQFLNGWGETVANINERLYPSHPSGRFAACLKGAQVALPAGVQRVDLPVRYSRVLLRVALGDDAKEAERLQHAFTMEATGSPATPTLPEVPDFEPPSLPDVALFELGPALLDSEVDINPGMAGLQDKVRAIAQAIADPAERARVDQVIHARAIPDFFKASPMLGHGTIRNGWARPKDVGAYGDDWLTRSLINEGGIWANTMDEVVYYKGNVDGDGQQLNGDHVYTLTFPADALPQRFAKYFWSVIAVDDKRFRVLPNGQNRFLLNAQTHPQLGEDGSLTLYFAADKPADAPEGNWLPTPRGTNYRLTFRFYGPQGGVADGSYFPPPLVKRS